MKIQEVIDRLMAYHPDLGDAETCDGIKFGDAQVACTGIVSAIVALAKTLNLKVVAEGVETAAQQTFLTELGCNTLQGYLLGKPITAQAIMEQCQHGEMSLPRTRS